jgi:ADP-dependent NAD(P)H-hydrate dehydratase
MKGASTHVVSPQGEALLNNHGTIGLATSGSGDTLAGILTGLVARGAAPFLATAWAVYMHAEAGRRLAARVGPLGLIAREIPGEIPAIMREFD